jgi:DNA repair exonuclease SbcCD ATPase subunit
MAMEFSIGGFNVKGWMVAVALPVLSTVSGGVYFGYDTLNRFYGVEGGVGEALGNTSTNAKQIAELQKSLTKLNNDTARERTANKTFAANQLTTASQAIRKELQEVETNLSDDSVAKIQQLTQNLNKIESTATSRIQTVEQAIVDNDVRGLNSKLAQLATNMQQILEQQKVLLDLRSQVDKATTITDGIGDKLDVIQTEIDDIWKAYDEMVSNPL